MKTYTNPVYPWKRSPDHDVQAPRRPVIIVGAGPVGLAAAIDLAQQNVPVVVLDEDDTVSVGSRAICYAKRALEILVRLGCGERIVRRGVEWKVGRVFFRDEQVYSFDLLPETGHTARRSSIRLPSRMPGRPAGERERARWRNKVVAAAREDVLVRVATPEGGSAHANG
jgi:3-(3-hydroxy-phenyl)propionate hydroxylase